jgi:hypothetical protein
MKRFMWILALPFAAACSGISVSHDYDPQTDFAPLKTYAWHPTPAGTPTVDSLTFQRIVRAVDDGLAMKGFQKTDGPNPDFKVHAMASIQQRIQTQPVTMGVGYGWRHGYVAAESLEVSTYDEGTLIIDVFSPATKNLIWRGTARAAVDPDRTPEEREGRIREAAFKILERFPPLKKK